HDVILLWLCDVLHVFGFSFFFFFSSRRRHTRFKCDWSSDVCSSDLHAHQELAERHARGNDTIGEVIRGFRLRYTAAAHIGKHLRSEERRVGKECRSWWWEYAEKKKKMIE